jgi:hypothetical protein
LPPGPQPAEAPRHHHRTLCKTHARSENAFARLNDWCAIATRHPRCGDLLLSAIALAATVIFWMR